MNNDKKQADDRILGKIKKCLALSASANEHEAAAAMRQAQKLMEEYNVTQSGLLQAELGEVSVKSRASATVVNPWENQLLWSVSRAFGCRLLWSGSHVGYGSFILIGVKNQVQMAEYAVVVLQRQLMKGRANFIATLPTWYSKKEKSTAANGYCFGWVEAIKKQIHDLAQSDEITKAIEDHIAERSHGKARSRKQSIDAESYQRGMAAAGKVSLHRPMSGAEQRVMIGNK